MVINATMNGLTAISQIAGSGTVAVFGAQQVAAFAIIAFTIGALAYVGLDIVVGVCLGGLIAIGFGFIGWLPMQQTLFVVLIIWGLGFAYFTTIFHGSH